MILYQVNPCALAQITLLRLFMNQFNTAFLLKEQKNKQKKNNSRRNLFPQFLFLNRVDYIRKKE